MQKQDSFFCCIQEIHLNIKYRHYLREQGWGKIFQANRSKKKAGIHISISNKLDFKPKLIGRNERTLHTYKRKIQQDDILIINIYAPNMRTLKFLKETLLHLK
jgi:exonuclease III